MNIDQTEFLKKIVNKNLLDAFIEFAKEDNVLQKAIEKSINSETTINSLIAAIVCIRSREDIVLQKLGGFIKAHPEINKAVEIKDIRDKLSNKEVK